MARTVTTVMSGALGLALAGTAFDGAKVDAVGPLAAGAPAPATAQTAAASQAAASPERALLDKYCVTCHNQRLETAGLMLDQVNPNNVAEHPDIWEKVVRKLRSGSMPPAGLPRPDTGAFAGWLETALDRYSGAKPNVGRLTVHRLNRTEYANAIRDLLALDVDGRALLPADDSGYGFDNNGDVLTVSPGLLERYMLAAVKISRLAIGDPTLRPKGTVYKTSPLMLQDERQSEDLPFGSRGGLAIRHHFPLDGEYTVKVSLRKAWPVNAEPQQLEVRLDRERVKLFRLGRQPASDTPTAAADATPGDAKPAAGEPLELRIPVKAGTRLIGVSFVDALSDSLPFDARPPRPPVASFAFTSYDANVPAVSNIDITGPFSGQVPEETASRKKIFACYPASAADEKPCARKILSTLARRAYRRPVTDTDLQPLLAAFTKGEQTDGFEIGIQRALEHLLVSPKFVFRRERDPANAARGLPYRVSDLELASRLSFFLWSSLPDDELVDIAARGNLKDPVVLEQQVRRMLADEKANALVTNFGGQWLWQRNLLSVAPNATLFPDFDDNLREAFQKETELFVGSQILEDRSVVELLSANYTFLNERLAKHYGISNVYGSHFRRVTYPDDRRAGLLGQGSILTVTSPPNRTSPVIRGKWVLENLLGAPPPPPPPDIPALKENGEGIKATAVRERLEQHRKNPMCATCHQQMDPLGFALENFDAIGQWRGEDAEAHTPIDASGVLVDGTKFDGPVEFRKALLGHKEQFVRTVADKLFTYALGRGLEYYDASALRKIIRDAAPANYRWSALILSIVESAPFQMRMPREPGSAKPADADNTSSPKGRLQ